jgi:hypothetical protein
MPNGAVLASLGKPRPIAFRQFLAAKASVPKNALLLTSITLPIIVLFEYRFPFSQVKELHNTAPNPRGSDSDQAIIGVNDEISDRVRTVD